jgi:16S rRNA (guanine527-N7)-methyltransferase
MGIPAAEPQLRAMDRHLQLLAETNASFNLTAVPESEYVPLHVLDSAVALPFLDSAPPGAFGDLGSGAGFPAVPLAILCARPVVLVESVKKKAAFLERVAAELCLEASIQGIRAEELALVRGRGFAAITARALAPLPSLVELASPLLQEGGLLISLKGSPDESEFSRGDAVALRCGMERVATVAVAVPRVDARRTVVVYRRFADPSVVLPRRSGMAQRRPLA